MTDHFIPSVLFQNIAYFIRNDYLLNNRLDEINNILGSLSYNIYTSIQINYFINEKNDIYNKIIINNIEIKKYSSILHDEYKKYYKKYKYDYNDLYNI